MPTEAVEALVVGAGLAGAAVACGLAAHGSGPVVGLEASTPAAGATGRAAGIVSEQLWNRWDVEVVRESRAEYAAWAARLGTTVYRANGFLRWTAAPEVGRLLRSRTEELRGWGVDVREVDPAELGALLPGLRTDGLDAAAFAPGDAVVAPSALAEAYVAEGRRRGVDWRLGSTVPALVRTSRGWSVTVRNTTYNSRVAVVAAGAWSKRLLAGAGHPLPLTPYRTQAAVLRRADGVPASIPSFHDLDTDVYARPEESGRLLAGDGTEKVEADPETFAPTGDAAFVAHLAEAFDRRFSGWSDLAVVRAWAGVCVATPDRRPLIGPVPGAPGLYVITGFNGFGVMRAAGAAARLVEAIAAGAAAATERLAPVDPARFAGPVRAFPPRPGFTLEGGDAPTV